MTRYHSDSIVESQKKKKSLVIKFGNHCKEPSTFGDPKKNCPSSIGDYAKLLALLETQDVSLALYIS